MCEACPQDHNHISRNGAQGDVRGTGTTSVHREHSSGNRKLPLVSTVKDLRGKQAGGGATQVLPVLAYLDILSGLNPLRCICVEMISLLFTRGLGLQMLKENQWRALGLNFEGSLVSGRHWEGDATQEAFACSVTSSYQIFPELIFAKWCRV